MGLVIPRKGLYQYNLSVNKLNVNRLLILSMVVALLGYMLIIIYQDDGNGFWLNFFFLIIFVPVTGFVLALVGAVLFEVGKFIKGWLHDEY